MEGQYRSLSYVGKHTPVVVDEPLHLFGQDLRNGMIIMQAGQCNTQFI